MKYGLMLAIGQLGWEATPEVAGRLWRRLRDRMASCDLDVVNCMVAGVCAGSCTPSMGLPSPPCMMGGASCTTGMLPQTCGNDLQNGTVAGQAAVRPVLLPGGRQV